MSDDESTNRKAPPGSRWERMLAAARADAAQQSQEATLAGAATAVIKPDEAAPQEEPETLTGAPTVQLEQAPESAPTEPPPVVGGGPPPPDPSRRSGQYWRALQDGRSRRPRARLAGLVAAGLVVLLAAAALWTLGQGGDAAAADALPSANDAGGGLSIRTALENSL